MGATDVHLVIRCPHSLCRSTITVQPGVAALGDPPQGGHECGDTAVVERSIVLCALHLAPGRQDVVKMAFPPCRVFPFPPSPAAGAWEPHEPDYYLQAAAGLWRVRRLHLYFREQCPTLFPRLQPFTHLLEPLIPIAEQKYGLEPLRPNVKPVGLQSQTSSDGSRLVVSSSGILKIDPQSPYLPQDSSTTS